ncbi:hypothetical protein ACWHY4_06980 [Pseudomonas sp. E2-15]
MTTQDTQVFGPESFEATLYFSTSEEHFKANRVSVEETTTPSGVVCWTLKAYEDTQDKKDGTTEINTLRLHIKKDFAGGPVQIVSALSPPDIRENSAAYYKLKDSPDDDDDLVDTAYEFPSIKGELVYSWPDNRARITGAFNFKVKNPDNTAFEIKCAYNILNKGMHSI